MNIKTLLGCALVPCLADMGLPFSHSGQLQVSFEDVTIRTDTGSQRSAYFAQTHSLALTRPLMTPAFGEVRGALAYQQGKNLAQLVSGGSAAQTSLGYSLAGDLLSPRIRRFVTLGINTSRGRNRTGVGGLPLRDIWDTLLGGSVGLSLPHLPSYHLTYQATRRQELASVSPVDQDLVDLFERAAYVRGPWRFDYTRSRRKVADHARPVANAQQDTLSGTADLNLPTVRVKGLESVFFRSSYRAETIGAPARTLQRTFTANAYLTSRRLTRRRIESYLGYGQNVSRDLVSHQSTSGYELSMFSKVISSRWDVNNRLRYQLQPESPDRSIAGEQLNLETRWGRGLMGYRFQGDETYRWFRASTATVTDALLQRVSCYPISTLDVYIQQNYTATRAAGDSLQQRAWGGGTGVHWTPWSGIAGLLSYEQTLLTTFALPQTTRLHTVSASINAAPLSQLTTTVSYLIQMAKTTGARPLTSQSGTLSLAASYIPRLGWNLAGELYYTESVQRASTATRSSGWNAMVSGSYVLGLTTISLLAESRELSTPNAYRRLRTVLSRAF